MQIDNHLNPKIKVAPVPVAYQQEAKGIESLLMQALSLYHKVANVNKPANLPAW